MEQNTMTPNGPWDEAGASIPSASQLLQALSTEDHQRLANLAYRFLSRAGHTPQARRYLQQTSPQDVVEQVFLKVLRAESNPRRGRRLKRHNRASTEAFVACLRGLIHDEVKNLVNHAEAAYPHLPIGDKSEDPSMIDPPDQTDTVRLLSQRDLQGVVFLRLYDAAVQEPELLPIIKQWESSFLSDDRAPRVPTGSRLACRVRALVRQILEELARERDLGQDGREML